MEPNARVTSDPCRSDDLSGPAWYLHPELYHTPLHCALEATLEQASSRGDTPYLNQLAMVGSCQ